MKQKWKKQQYVEISMDEIFCFQDKLDAAKDDPEKIWDVVDAFFLEVENQLELDPGFIQELQQSKIDKTMKADLDNLFVEIDNPHEKTAQDYVNYVLNQANQKRYNIPFNDRIQF